MGHRFRREGDNRQGSDFRSGVIVKFNAVGQGVEGAVPGVAQFEMQVGAGNSARIPGIGDNISPPHRNVGASEPEVQGIPPLAFLEGKDPPFQARGELLQMGIYGHPLVFQAEVKGFAIAFSADQESLHVSVFHGIDLIPAGAVGGDVQSRVVPARPHVAEGGGDLSAGFCGPFVILAQSGADEQEKSQRGKMMVAEEKVHGAEI